MPELDKILSKMIHQPAGVRFAELFRVCEYYFGPARQSGSSHAIFKTPWLGDPRVNIHNDKGKAKPYQVKQVLEAVKKLKESKNEH